MPPTTTVGDIALKAAVKFLPKLEDIVLGRTSLGKKRRCSSIDSQGAERSLDFADAFRFTRILL